MNHSTFNLLVNRNFLATIKVDLIKCVDTYISRTTCEEINYIEEKGGEDWIIK